MIKRATIWQMPWAVDFTNGANIPLAINANMAKVVAFEASLGVAWVVTVKWTIYRCPLNSPFRQDFVIQFCVLDSQFNGGSERGGGGGGYNLRVGRCGQFGRISVTLDSGRGKCRLEDVEGTKILEGLLQRMSAGGFRSKS